MSNVTALSRSWIDSWLSPSRFDVYATACDGNLEDALALYEWNITLGQILLRDLSHFEIGMRNAYDAAITNHWNGSSHWLFDESSPVRRPIMRKSRGGQLLDSNHINRKQIDQAKNTLGSKAAADQVLSSMTLGFWTHMTDRTHERDLWIPCIHHVWPKGTNRVELHRKIQTINTLRNRVAHHEHLFNPGDTSLLPTKVDEIILHLFRQLCPEAAEWLYPVNRPTPLALFFKESAFSAQVHI